MRHWLWLSLALAAVLAPGAAAAQDEDKDATEESDTGDAGAEAKTEGEGADAEAKAEGEADAEAKAEVKAEASFDFDADADADADAKGKPKGKDKRKRTGKPRKKKPKPEPAEDDTSVSAALVVGYGFQPYYGLAAGLRLGWDIGSLYVGGTGIYAFGETIEDESRAADLTFSTTANFIQVGAELGYNAPVEGLLIRPYLGLGIGISPLEDCAWECESETRVRPYLAPGATVLYPIDMFFVGADLRYNILLGLANASGVMLAATAGLWF